ncbi:MAG: hypothetical protein ACLP9L_22240 [Thermoguttaceae bacterium]
MAMTSTTTARKGWVNHIPSQRIRQAPALDPEARAYFMATDDLRRDRPYFTDRPAKVAAACGLGKGPAALRRLQRIEARLEKEGKLRRVLVRGRVDKVSGRETFTGRIGVIPLVTFTELPIITLDEVPDLDAWMRSEGNRRQRNLPFEPIVARQICRATPPSCTTNLSPLPPPTEGLERVTDTTTYAADPESSSFLDCIHGEEEDPQTLEDSEAAARALGFPPSLSRGSLECLGAFRAMLCPAAVETPAAPAIAPPPAAQALDQTLFQVWVTALIALGLRRSKSDQTQILGALAESLISRAARFYRGGLRWVAWAIHEAAHRRTRDRGPVKFWTWIVVTLRNWQDGDGAPPDGWPKDPTADAELPRARAAPPAPDAMSAAKLAAMIAELEDQVANTSRAAKPLVQKALDMAREELAALKNDGRPSP